MIPAAKLEGLRSALERDGEVEFRNGAKVRRETVVKLVVEGPWGGVSRFGENELAAAYEMALHGARAVAQPKGDPAKFGDPPPF